MKKFTALFLAAILIFSMSTAGAVVLRSLRETQDFLMKFSPNTMDSYGEHMVLISGTIQEIRWCNANNHYEMTLAVDEENALVPIGSDTPQLTVHFRLHVDPMPFAVGDEVEVVGSLNSLYSSVMLPNITAETINGSEDF